MNWILTKDRKPSFEECKGKAILCHLESDESTIVFADVIQKEFDFSFTFDHAPHVDRYILIDIPEYVPEIDPVPCRVCGEMPDIRLDPAYSNDPDPHVIECTRGIHVISFAAPTRDEAVKLWNKHNS